MRKSILVVSIIFVFIIGCASLSQLIQKPTVKLDKVSMQNFSFQDITLNFDLAVSNPNPFGIKLAGYDYDFSIQQQNFLSGDQAQDVQILASQTSKFGVPVTIKFKELYQMFKSMSDVDEAGYNMKGHVHLKGPWGLLKVPFSTTGKIPAVKLPKISLAGVQVQSLSFSGVKLDLAIDIENPNIFGFSLNNFNYDIALAGKKVLNGNNTEQTAIPKKGKTTLKFPINLNFMAMGSMLQSALQQGKIDYTLTGGANLKTEYGNAQIPINKSGNTKMWK